MIWPKERWTPAAWATKIEATPRYSVDPSRLNEYPVGITNETMGRGTPNFVMFSIAVGSAASLLVVLKAMIAGSFTARMNALMGILRKYITGTNAKRAKTTSAP